MTVIEAVVEHGLLRPLAPIALSEGQRVRLCVEPILAGTPDDVVELLGRAGDGLSPEQWNTIEASIQDGLHFRDVESKPRT